MEFEEIKTELADTFRRARIFGGWLIIVTSEVVHYTENGWDGGWDWRTSISFVFDPLHLWKLKEVGK